MTSFSANLGFLWSDIGLTDAIRAAKIAGFDAVECHWPYDTPAEDVSDVLFQTGLDMIGLNTRRGDVLNGENGLAALPGREDDAWAAIDEAIAYAAIVGAKSVHVMAGVAEGDEAHSTFVLNLRYACEKAAEHGLKILIEPLNKYDAPGYFLKTTDQAVAIIDEVNADDLKLMFDCYHVQLTEGDVSHRLEKHLSKIGHIQFASVPDRGPPDHGELNYEYIFRHITELGYTRPLGAEYKPNGDTSKTLGWLADQP